MEAELINVSSDFLEHAVQASTESLKDSRGCCFACKFDPIIFEEKEGITCKCTRVVKIVDGKCNQWIERRYVKGKKK